MDTNLKDQLLIKQAENDVLAAYNLAHSVDFFAESGFNKSASISDEDQALYDYAANHTLTKLAEEGVIDLGGQDLSAEDVANIIIYQAQNDALADNDLAEAIDFMGQYGMSKSANWAEECQDLYASVYETTVTELSNELQKSASYDPMAIAAQAFVDEITTQSFNRNLKKTATDFEVEYLNSFS